MQEIKLKFKPGSEAWIIHRSKKALPSDVIQRKFHGMVLLDKPAKVEITYSEVHINKGGSHLALHMDKFENTYIEGLGMYKTKSEAQKWINDLKLRAKKPIGKKKTSLISSKN